MSTSRTVRYRLIRVAAARAIPPSTHFAALSIFAAALTVACSNQRDVNEPASPPPLEEPEQAGVPTTEAAAPEVDEPVPEPAPDDSSARSIAPEALNRLVAAVERLGSGAMDRSHTASVEALRAFAAAIAALPSADAQASEEIQTTAERLASSHETSLEHADMVQHGLQAGLTALSGVDAPDEQKPEYRDSVEQLQTAIQSVDPERPLLSQNDAVVTAFRAAANAVAIAGNAPVPFPAVRVSAR